MHIDRTSGGAFYVYTAIAVIHPCVATPARAGQGNGEQVSHAASPLREAPLTIPCIQQPLPVVSLTLTGPRTIVFYKIPPHIHKAQCVGHKSRCWLWLVRLDKEMASLMGGGW